MNLKKLQKIFVLLYSFSIVFENYDGFSIGGASIPKFVGIALLILLSFNARYLFNTVLFNRMVKPIIGFVLVIFFSSMTHTDYDLDWLTKLSTLLLNVVFYWMLLAFILRNPEFSENLLIAFVAAVSVSSILFLFNIGVIYTDGRLTIFGENANVVGIYCVFAFTYIFIKFMNRKDKKKFINFLPLLFFIPFLNIMALTGSRITFLGLVFTISMYFIVNKNKASGSGFAIKLIGVLVIYLLVNYLLSFDVLASRFDATVSDGDLSGRDQIWNDVLPTLLESPIFGVGISGYTEVISIYFGHFFSAHNVYIEVFAYSGGVGFFLLFFVFFVRLIRYSFDINKILGNPMALIFVLFILLIFSSGQGLTSKFYWLIYVYVFGEFLRSRNEKELLKK